MAFADEAKAIQKLAATVQSDTTASKTTRQAAQAADKAAQKMEAELRPIEKLQAALRTARDMRESAGTNWDTTLADPHASKKVKELAGSALSQADSRRRKRR